MTYQLSGATSDELNLDFLSYRCIGRIWTWRIVGGLAELFPFLKTRNSWALYWLRNAMGLTLRNATAFGTFLATILYCVTTLTRRSSSLNRYSVTVFKSPLMVSWRGGSPTKNREEKVVTVLDPVPTAWQDMSDMALDPSSMCKHYSFHVTYSTVHISVDLSRIQ